MDAASTLRPVHDAADRPTVLVVDDERPILDLLKSFLSSCGFEIETTEDPEKALALLARKPYDVLLSDIKMKGVSGVELLERAREIDPEAVVVLMTGHPSVGTAIRSLKAKAFDYVTKPFDLEDLHGTLERAADVRRLSRDNADLKDSLRLYRVTQAVSSAVDEREIATMVVGSIHEEIEADRVALFVEGPHGLDPWTTRGESIDDGYERALARRAAAAPEALAVGPDEGAAGVAALAAPLRSGGQAIGAVVALRKDRARPFGTGHVHTMAIFASSVATAIKGARHSQRALESRARLVEANAATIGALIAALDAREHDTRLHSLRVTEYTLRLARSIDYPVSQLVDLKFGAMLHDIGKIGLPDQILMKSGPLDDAEWQEMRRHPMTGYQILRDIKFLERAAKIVLYHQERWDGSGYPVGLRGEEIPLGARLFAVVDTYDAMTSDRPYRAALGWNAAVQEIEKNSGILFDPRVVDGFLSVPREEWERIRREVMENRFRWSRLSLRGGFAGLLDEAPARPTTTGAR